MRDRPVTRRHYDTLFKHVQAALAWTRRTPVTAHVLRHTAGTAVERVAGYAVAEGDNDCLCLMSALEVIGRLVVTSTVASG